MVFITTPLFGIAIIPIIIIESMVLLRYLKINKKLAFKTATISNLVSTFVGISISSIVDGFSKANEMRSKLKQEKWLADTYDISGKYTTSWGSISSV